MSVTANDVLPRPRGDARVIGLVSAGHFVSHFYLLLLPPLFPLLREVYGVGFTELGAALALFGLTSALTQAPMGFLVDRFGARQILIGGLVLEALAFGLIGVFPFYSALLGLMVLAGLGNAVYHPADYTILNASVNPERMGRAFSIHTAAGFVGDAAGPVVILILLSVIGWQSGLMVCGAIGLLVAGLLQLNSGLLRDVAPEQSSESAGTTAAGIRLLFTLPILMGWLFFVGIAMTGGGVRGFGISILNQQYEVSLHAAGVVLSAYLFASPVGVLVGGWLADRVKRHDLVAALCFSIIGCAILTVAAFPLPLPVIAGLFMIAGFCTGVVAPSRDMLIRKVTPPGQTGKVFGFVSTGFNIGGVLAPLLFGYIMDHAEPTLVFWLAGLLSFVTIVTVLETGRRGRAG